MAQSHPAGTRMTGGQILIRELLERGVDTIFCVPGESYLEVLDAQRQLFSAELGLSQTQLLELSSVVGLYRALGGSWEVPVSP